MLSKYKDSQKIFYDYFNRINDINHVSHAYMIETNNVSYSFNLATDLAKFLLCNGKYNEKVCNLIDGGNYPNFKVIGNNVSIKKDDIISLRSDFSKSSINGGRQVYIINNVENLNKSSANSLLKFLEEPDGDVIAILLCDSSINVLSTIVSRCQVISLINDDDVYKGIFSSLYGNENSLNFEDFVSNKMNEFLKWYLKFENLNTYLLADKDFYLLKDEFKEFLAFGFYLYFDVLNYKFDRFVKSSFVDEIKKISDKNDTRDIIKKIEVIDGFIFNLRYNVNMNLFMDNFIIRMGSVKNEKGNRN